MSTLQSTDTKQITIWNLSNKKKRKLKKEERIYAYRPETEKDAGDKGSVKIFRQESSVWERV